MIDGYKEDNIILMTYEDVHEDARNLADQILLGGSQKFVLLPVARGGWHPARLVGSRLEEMGYPNESFSIGVTYKDIGSPNEYVELTQGLDVVALNRLIDLHKQGYSLWVIEGICHTGRAMYAVRRHLVDTLEKYLDGPFAVNTGALHWTRYVDSPQTPWRLDVVLEPDRYGKMIESTEKPHIEYPWERSTIATVDRGAQ